MLLFINIIQLICNKHVETPYYDVSTILNLKTKRQFSGKYRKIFREVVEIHPLKWKHP